MQSFYVLCLAAAFSLFLWQSVSDARQSVVQQTMLLVIIIPMADMPPLQGLKICGKQCLPQRFYIQVPASCQCSILLRCAKSAACI